MVRKYLVRPPSAKNIGDNFKLRGMRKEKFVVLNVLIEWEEFCLGWRVIGLEKREIEMVLINRNVDDQTYAAHKH